MVTLSFECVVLQARLHSPALGQTLTPTCKVGWTSRPLLTSLMNLGIKVSLIIADNCIASIKLQKWPNRVERITVCPGGGGA